MAGKLSYGEYCFGKAGEVCCVEESSGSVGQVGCVTECNVGLSCGSCGKVFSVKLRIVTAGMLRSGLF